MEITDWYVDEYKDEIRISYMSDGHRYLAGVQVYCTTLDEVILQHTN